MERTDEITVDEVLDWAAKEEIDLGRNPRRTLVYLAGKRIIPKTIKGPNCKGIYKRDEVLPRLVFYHNRRKEGWRIQDIKVAIFRLEEAHKESSASPLPFVDFWKDRVDSNLLVLPLADSFKTVFLEFLRRNPAGAESLFQFLDEQEMLTGIKISSSLRNLIGIRHLEYFEEKQTRIRF